MAATIKPIDYEDIRLLYVDIDGVLNSGHYYDIYRMKEEEAEKVEWDKYHAIQDAKPRCERITNDNPCEPHISALNELKSKVPGLRLVISSTWRHEMDSWGWDRFFSTLGIDVPVIAKTDRLGTWRGTEVLTHLLYMYGTELKEAYNMASYGNHNGSTIKRVVGWAAIDDDYDYGHEYIKPNWYCVKGEVGFAHADVDKLAEILLRPVVYPAGFENLQEVRK
jgi:hypothetical protein